jgi:uncharacterized protein (DUF2267 family)
MSGPPEAVRSRGLCQPTERTKARSLGSPGRKAGRRGSVAGMESTNGHSRRYAFVERLAISAGSAVAGAVRVVLRAVASLPGAGDLFERLGGGASREDVHIDLRTIDEVMPPDLASDVDDSVLVDRVRTALGPLEERLDIPRVNVMVEGHVVDLRGIVPNREAVNEIEALVYAIAGVVGLESHLNVGQDPGETKPSTGRRHKQSTRMLQNFEQVARDAGVTEADAQVAVRAVLRTFLERLPAGERDQVLTHLTADTRQLIGVVPDRSPAGSVRTRAELVGLVAVDARLEPVRAEEVMLAVLGSLQHAVPEEVKDIAATLPEQLEQLWREAGRHEANPVR